MVGNITKIQREEEGRKGRKYDDKLSFKFHRIMQTGHPLALLLENALADYRSNNEEHKLIYETTLRY